MRARSQLFLTLVSMLVSSFKTNTPELFQGVPGFTVHGSTDRQRVERSIGLVSDGFARLSDAQSDPSALDSRFPQWHGHWRRVGAGERESAEIEAMEVYKGPAELPAEARGRGCAADV